MLICAFFGFTSKAQTLIKDPDIYRLGTVEDMRWNGEQDATENYKGDNSGAGWTCATAIIFSPVTALIPAISCGSKIPNDVNLNCPDAVLLLDNNYNLGYKRQAFRMKKKKVWKNFAIGSGVWVSVIVGRILLRNL